ncbi:MAG: UbiH/UbiF family hydroxylase [Hyphomicrobium sp.]
MPKVYQSRIAVVGGGPAGLAAALSMAALDIELTLVAPHLPAEGVVTDRRTAALFAGSVTLLHNLGVWESCRSQCAPLTGIRIVDDTGALLRAPEVVFRASEVDLESFGYNVPNSLITRALDAAIARRPNVQVLRSRGVTDIAIDPSRGSVRLTVAEGDRIETRLVVGADGRSSPSRTAAGIATRAWTYPQTALVTTFAHSRPHQGISTELHRPAGPLTTVPMPGEGSSLVWVEKPDGAGRLASLDADGFRGALEERLQGLLGAIGEITPRATFPLSGLAAETAGRNRVALVGEAAHVIPPIGAQGLNLGLRDAAAVAECVAQAIGAGQEIGGQAMLAAYAEARRLDIATRVTGIDLLNRSLIMDMVPTHLLRGLGLHVLNAVGPLKRLVVREGLQPSQATASLMRPDGVARLRARAATAGAGERAALP